MANKLACAVAANGHGKPESFTHEILFLQKFANGLSMKMCTLKVCVCMGMGLFQSWNWSGHVSDAALHLSLPQQC